MLFGEERRGEGEGWKHKCSARRISTLLLSYIPSSTTTLRLLPPTHLHLWTTGMTRLVCKDLERDMGGGGLLAPSFGCSYSLQIPPALQMPLIYKYFILFINLKRLIKRSKHLIKRSTVLFAFKISETHFKSTFPLKIIFGFPVLGISTVERCGPAVDYNGPRWHSLCAVQIIENRIWKSQSPLTR